MCLYRRYLTLPAFSAYERSLFLSFPFALLVLVGAGEPSYIACTHYVHTWHTRRPDRDALGKKQEEGTIGLIFFYYFFFHLISFHFREARVTECKNKKGGKAVNN